jgi:hypothetical protein
MPTPLRCPECGAPLEIVTDGAVGVPHVSSYHRREADVPVRMVRRPFAACGRCEFCIEIDVRRPTGRD